LLLPFVDLFAALCGNGMLESMLEPHLNATGATTIDVGVSFLVKVYLHSPTGLPDFSSCKLPK
jgi:hypothetical protein